MLKLFFFVNWYGSIDWLYLEEELRDDEVGARVNFGLEVPQVVAEVGGVRVSVRIAGYANDEVILIGVFNEFDQVGGILKVSVRTDALRAAYV